LVPYGQSAREPWATALKASPAGAADATTAVRIKVMRRLRQEPRMGILRSVCCFGVL
jgi:hypothetical protein